MSEALAAGIWLGLVAYLGVGLVAGVAVFGMERLTQAAVPVRVRLFLQPGLAALWPVVLMRLAGVKAPEDRA